MILRLYQITRPIFLPCSVSPDWQTPQFESAAGASIPILMNTDRIMNIIQEIISEKELRRQEPLHALYSEIHARLPALGMDIALQHLVAAGRIEEHPTIRETCYTLK